MCCFVAAKYRTLSLAQSRASFISKLSIVIEEIDETEFLLEFIIDERLVALNIVESLKTEAYELACIFCVILDNC